MKIAEKLMNGQATPEEVKYLLWMTLLEVQDDTVGFDLDDDEEFNVEEMLDALDEQLGMTP